MYGFTTVLFLLLFSIHASAQTCRLVAKGNAVLQYQVTVPNDRLDGYETGKLALPGTKFDPTEHLQGQCWPNKKDARKELNLKLKSISTSKQWSFWIPAGDPSCISKAFQESTKNYAEIYKPENYFCLPPGQASSLEPPAGLADTAEDSTATLLGEEPLKPPRPKNPGEEGYDEYVKEQKSYDDWVDMEKKKGLIDHAFAAQSCVVDDLPRYWTIHIRIPRYIYEAQRRRRRDFEDALWSQCYHDSGKLKRPDFEVLTGDARAGKRKFKFSIPKLARNDDNYGLECIRRAFEIASLKRLIVPEGLCQPPKQCNVQPGKLRKNTYDIEVTIAKTAPRSQLANTWAETGRTIKAELEDNCYGGYRRRDKARLAFIMTPNVLPKVSDNEMPHKDTVFKFTIPNGQGGFECVRQSFYYSSFNKLDLSHDCSAPQPVSVQTTDPPPEGYSDEPIRCTATDKNRKSWEMKVTIMKFADDLQPKIWKDPTGKTLREDIKKYCYGVTQQDQKEAQSKIEWLTSPDPLVRGGSPQDTVLQFEIPRRPENPSVWSTNYMGIGCINKPFSIASSNKIDLTRLCKVHALPTKGKQVTQPKGADGSRSVAPLCQNLGPNGHYWKMKVTMAFSGSTKKGASIDPYKNLVSECYPNKNSRRPRVLGKSKTEMEEAPFYQRKPTTDGTGFTYTFHIQIHQDMYDDEDIECVGKAFQDAFKDLNIVFPDKGFCPQSAIPLLISPPEFLKPDEILTKYQGATKDRIANAAEVTEVTTSWAVVAHIPLAAIPRYGSHQMVSLNSVGGVFISNCYKWVDLQTTKKRLDFTIGKEVSDKKSGLMFDFVIPKHKRADDFACIADAFRPASKMNIMVSQEKFQHVDRLVICNISKDATNQNY